MEDGWMSGGRTADCLRNPPPLAPCLPPMLSRCGCMGTGAGATPLAPSEAPTSAPGSLPAAPAGLARSARRSGLSMPLPLLPSVPMMLPTCTLLPMAAGQSSGAGVTRPAVPCTGVGAGTGSRVSPCIRAYSDACSCLLAAGSIEGGHQVSVTASCRRAGQAKAGHMQGPLATCLAAAVRPASSAEHRKRVFATHLSHALLCWGRPANTGDGQKAGGFRIGGYGG